MGCKEKLTMHIDFRGMEYKDKTIHTATIKSMVWIVLPTGLLLSYCVFSENSIPQYNICWPMWCSHSVVNETLNFILELYALT